MFTLPETVQCGYFDSSRTKWVSRSPDRRATKYEIELYLEDGLQTVAEDTVSPIRKHYVHITKPGQLRYSYLPFRTAYLKFPAEGPLASMLEEAPRCFACHHGARVEALVSEIILLQEKGNTLGMHSRVLALLEIILADAAITGSRSEKDRQILSAAKKYIRTHYARPIRLHDVAQSVFLSDIYFRTLFVEMTGVSPHRYLTDYRIEVAKQHLWHTQKTISQIAEETGFGCQQYFNKVFKKEVGLTPAAYRQKFQQNYLYEDGEQKKPIDAREEMP